MSNHKSCLAAAQESCEPWAKKNSMSFADPRRGLTRSTMSAGPLQGNRFKCRIMKAGGHCCGVFRRHAGCFLIGDFPARSRATLCHRRTWRPLVLTTIDTAGAKVILKQILCRTLLLVFRLSFTTRLAHKGELNVTSITGLWVYQRRAAQSAAKERAYFGRDHDCWLGSMRVHHFEYLPRRRAARDPSWVCPAQRIHAHPSLAVVPGGLAQ